MKIHNFFDFEVKDSAGNIKKRAHAENIVLNQFISEIVGGSACFKSICVGTGTDEPAVTDTKLSAYLTGKNAALSGVSADWDNMIFSVRKSVTFSASELVGKTLTEVGVSYSSDDNSLCTHALIRDENGNVSSITKSDTEILTVHATVFADLSGVEKNGVYIQRYPNTSSTLSVDILPLAAQWALGVTSVYVSGSTNSCNAYDSVYPDDTYSCSKAYSEDTVRIIHPDITVNQYNNKSIKTVMVGKQGALCMSVPNVNFTQPEITNEVVGTGDGSNREYNTKFSLIKSAVVKVDGAEVTDVTVNLGLPQCAEQCFRLYDYPRVYNSDEQNVTAPIALFTNRNSISAVPGAWSVFENKYYSSGILIKKCSFDNIKVTLSNDLSTWTEIKSYQAIPEDLQNARYWKIERGSGSDKYCGLANIEWTRPSDIIFSEPPASGGEITVDYIPDCIAKDANHILRGIEFDLTFSG